MGDKDRGDGGDNRGKDDGLRDESFVHGVQSVGNCSLDGSVNSVKTGSFICVSIFFRWDFNLFS